MGTMEILVLLIVVFTIGRVVIGLKRGDKFTFGPPRERMDDMHWHDRHSRHDPFPDPPSSNDNRGPD